MSSVDTRGGKKLCRGGLETGRQPVEAPLKVTGTSVEELKRKIKKRQED